MYYLKLAQVRVPLKNFYAIRAGCAAEGEQIEKKWSLKKQILSVLVGTKPWRRQKRISGISVT